MKISPFLLAGVFSFGISSLEPVQDPARDLRAALGGDAALTTIERLHIKASFEGTQRGKGETEWFVVLPERLLYKTHSTQLRSTFYTSDKGYPVLTAGFQDMPVEYFDTTRVEGFVGSTPLASGELMPKWYKEETRQETLEAGRFSYAKLLLPLFGTASTVTSSFAISGGIVFQDRDRTTWTLQLDPSGLPASMAMDRQLIQKDIRFTRPIAPTVITFSDYRAVDGRFMWPHKLVMTANGETETTWIKSYEINGKAPKVLLK